MTEVRLFSEDKHSTLAIPLWDVESHPTVVYFFVLFPFSDPPTVWQMIDEPTNI